ncbi:nucleotidyltransferase domain-containing protein [Streptomyces sp. NPDC059917]|uniref:nucleotidyltransferase domain-containing protein n=1 Tax=Streptomyces sp. NPDC059917 TaxID=3347002 RepID=UPI003667B12C
MNMFNPTIEVIVTQPSTPNPPNLAFDAVLQRFPSLAEADAVCMTGSIAAGWGNSYSDIDLFVFSDRELDLPVDETMETWPGEDATSGIRWVNWMGQYEESLVDLQVWPTDTLPKVLKPFLGDTEPEFGNPGLWIEDLIYRISIATPLKNPAFIENMKQLIANSSYNRALARYLKARIESRLTDVAGQLEAGDILGARMAALLAAEQVVDQSLLLAGDLCRARKWILRRLEQTPQCGITVDEYRSVVLDGKRPDESDRECAVRVARWAQSQLVRTEDAALTRR